MSFSPLTFLRNRTAWTILSCSLLAACWVPPDTSLPSTKQLTREIGRILILEEQAAGLGTKLHTLGVAGLLERSEHQRAREVYALYYTYYLEAHHALIASNTPLFKRLVDHAWLELEALEKLLEEIMSRLASGDGTQSERTSPPSPRGGSA